MLKRLLALLIAFLTLGPDPGDVDPPDDPDPGEEPEPDEEEGLEEPDPDDAPDPKARSEEDIAALRTRAERAERDLADAREAARRAAPPPGPGQLSDEQRLHQHEEERLRAADITETERWQINANRTLRRSENSSAAALREAREMSDRNDFNSLCEKNPTAKKYAQKVEDKLKEIRGGGGNLDRRIVLKMLIGDDIVEGRVKSKKRDAADPGAGRVHREQLAVTRSDVRSKGGQSDRDKRRARLEGQNI